MPTLTTTIEVPSGDDREVAHPEIAIAYRYSPGCRAYTPRGEYAPIDPPEPPEVEFESAELLNADGLTATPQQVQKWGADYIASDAGYWRACDDGDRSSGPDPDDENDRRREDAEFFDSMPRDNDDY